MYQTQTHTHRNRARAIAVGAALLLIVSALGGASAQTLEYDVGIAFPEYVILYYWDRIDYEITEQQLTDFYFSSAPAISGGSVNTSAGASGVQLRADAGIGKVLDSGLLRDPASEAMWLGVADAWAIRSSSSSGQTRVSIRVRTATGNGPNGSRIRARDAALSSGGILGRSIVVPSTGFFGQRWGEAYLQVDLSQARRAGSYEGIEIEFVAENI